MKLMIQAIQAVTVELLGVVLVVWMLFGFASWGLKSAAGNRPSWHGPLAEIAFPKDNASRKIPDEVLRVNEAHRTEYVAQRLGHYGGILSAFSRDMVRDTWHSIVEVEPDLSAAQVNPAVLARSF